MRVLSFGCLCLLAATLLMITAIGLARAQTGCQYYSFTDSQGRLHSCMSCIYGNQTIVSCT